MLCSCIGICMAENSKNVSIYKCDTIVTCDQIDRHGLTESIYIDHSEWVPWYPIIGYIKHNSSKIIIIVYVKI